MGGELVPATVPKSAIPVAAFKEVYQTQTVEVALNDLGQGANEALRATYERMLKIGGDRFAVKPATLPEMESLYESLPNFGEVLDDVRKQLALCIETDDRLELTPMLLLGAPGIGKTHFAKRLSTMLGTGYGFVGMSSLTAGWVLSGASSQWKNAKPGKVFETLVNGDYANPVIVVDEIDKAGGDAQYDPLGALYTLLEHDTAREFIDEFVEIPIDAGDVIWIATANDARSIPEPILNRMNVYEIAPPDHEGARRIAQAIYVEIRDSHQWGSRFPRELGDDPLDRVALISPREMRRTLMSAFGNARLAKRDEITADDIETDRNNKKQRIGF
ncbi:MAG TPA: AAA family ATPase [Burkholderiaceae bacterium]|nr:AAA family ATPase [Burkholderiaceae bacterium]